MSEHNEPTNQPHDKPNGKAPDPEHRPRKRRKGNGNSRRRVFSPQYKLKILAEVDACTETGQIGAILRREGLYSSHLTDWRRQRDQGALAALGKKRGRKADPDAAMRRENARLQAENERLKAKLATAETIIDVQKKLCTLLGLETAPNGSKP